MDAFDAEKLKRQLRDHLKVFLGLLAVVSLNVALTYLLSPGTTRTIVQLILATVGGGLVLVFFMHLLTERKLTLVLLGLTFFLFGMMILLSFVAREDHPEATEFGTWGAVEATEPTTHVP